jgi:hypothetical protein
MAAAIEIAAANPDARESDDDHHQRVGDRLRGLAPHTPGRVGRFSCG